MARTKTNGGALAAHGTQPEEGAGFRKVLDAWTEDVQPTTQLERFLCLELATVQWRLDRLRRIENGVLWWAIDDIRDRNHEAAQHGHPTGADEMAEEDFFTVTMGRAFKFACAQSDVPVRISRVEAVLVRRMYKALDTLAKLRAPEKGAKRNG
jgi:hypothetical protein